MAGPGGGPPRKSHTKSRKGCRTCKKRHIRCDENFPQCRNCTKHSCRCDYMDMAVAGDEPVKGAKLPDLLTSPELQHMLDNWRITGETPLVELQVNDPGYWTRFSTVDLRLVYHIVTLSGDMHRRGYSACTVWALKMPTLIARALECEFVMSALLAFSASHLAWETKNLDTENLAYHHHGVALKGLHEAIGTFSQGNSETILAASMLLSWQVTEWRSWASLQQGVSTVMNAMRPWMHESELATYLHGQRSVLKVRTPTTPSFPPLPPASRAEDIRQLEHALTALQGLRMRLANYEELIGHVDHFIRYLQDLQRDLPIPAPEQAFSRLQVLRNILFWLPPALLRTSESDLGPIAVLSHFFAAALAVETLFPEIGGAYFGTISIVPIEKMYDVMRSRRNANPHDAGLQVAMSLLEAPMQLLSTYRTRQEQLAQTVPIYHQSPKNTTYMASHPRLASTAELPAAAMFAHSPVQSPPGMSASAPTYFQHVSGQPSTLNRQSSSIGTTMDRSMSSIGAGTVQMSYAVPPPPSYQTQPSYLRHDSSQSINYYDQAQAGIQPYGNPRFVSPTQVWT